MTNAEKKSGHRATDAKRYRDAYARRGKRLSRPIRIEKNTNFMGYLGFGRMPGQRTKGPEF